MSPIIAHIVRRTISVKTNRSVDLDRKSFSNCGSPTSNFGRRYMKPPMPNTIVRWLSICLAVHASAEAAPVPKPLYLLFICSGFFVFLNPIYRYCVSSVRWLFGCCLLLRFCRADAACGFTVFVMKIVRLGLNCILVVQRKITIYLWNDVKLMILRVNSVRTSFSTWGSIKATSILCSYPNKYTNFDSFFVPLLVYCLSVECILYIPKKIDCRVCLKQNCQIR